MNDFMEMYWGYRMWEQAAGQLLNTIGKEFLDRVDEHIHTFGLHGLPVASCYSLDGDVLSQWRAYADDGHGYAIGFDANALVQLPVRALRVLYDQDEQREEIKTFVHAMYLAEQKSGDQNKNIAGTFGTTAFVLSSDLTAMKNPAFVEEQEVRLVHLLDFEESNSSFKLVDRGGDAFGKEVSGAPVEFRMRENVPTAYIDLDITGDNTVNPIREVILGPKNEALASGISVFLETVGIPAVRIGKSSASYR